MLEPGQFRDEIIVPSAPVPKSLIILACLFLPGCLTGFEAHNLDMAGKIDTIERLTVQGVSPNVEVRFHMFAKAQRLCQQGNVSSEAMACVFHRSLQADPVGNIEGVDGLVIYAGIDCLVITPPNRTLYEHELRHCREGAYH